MKYIIIDIEATCWENDKSRNSETIEIGALKLDESLGVIGEFQAFIKPRINPILTEFCKKLTSIEQVDIESADEYSVIINRFTEWIGISNEGYLLCSWGSYDKKQLKKDCGSYNLQAGWLNKHISVKKKFEELYNIDNIEVEDALKMLGLEFEGRLHRGIDDARNIVKIFSMIFKEIKI